MGIVAPGAEHVHAVPVNQFALRIRGNLAFDFGIADKRHQREARIARMPERTRLGIVAPEIPVIAQATREVFRTGACILQVIHLFRRHVEFRRRKERRVVIDDVFLVVVAVGTRLADSLLFGQMSIGLLGRGKVLFARVVALSAEFCNACQARNRHAATFAEGRLVVCALDAVGTREGAEFALAHRRAPVVEHRHVEESLFIEHAHQEVRTEGSLVRSLRLAGS